MKMVPLEGPLSPPRGERVRVRGGKKPIFRIDAHTLACSDGTIRKMKIATLEGPLSPRGAGGEGQGGALDMCV